MVCGGEKMEQKLIQKKSCKKHANQGYYVEAFGALIQTNRIQKDSFEEIRDLYPHWVSDNTKELFSVLLAVKMLLW